MFHSNTRDSEQDGFVEADPTGRYGRYAEVLGKGSSKTVYRAFDEYEGIEVAWNQVRLNDFLQSPEDLERLYCEIHLLKTLKHKNIMKFCSSWVDISKRKINFVTEMFTSGTLRQYRQKHKRVNIRAVKHWCRQILCGLLYLHSHDPPIIHRDLKCDNIFVNGHQGEVKIGDLGLAAILGKPHFDHCVGTPEFMAPEVYEESYNELVDIYSFGMCVLEMVTFEYPYSECTHPAQIYKKVISGRKPDAFYKVKDFQVRRFLEKCLATVSERPSARELLNDPFLQIDDPGLTNWEGDNTAIGQIYNKPSFSCLDSDGSLISSRLSSDDSHFDMMVENGWDWDDDDPDSEITIKGTRRDDGSIFLRLRVSDKDGHVRNIYFPFDVENDTALGVATEMIAELNITDHDVAQIAEMIDGEVSSLVPAWKPGLDVAEISSYGMPSVPGNHESDNSSAHSLISTVSISNQSCGNLDATSCAIMDCAIHGRFEEITLQIERPRDIYLCDLDERERYIDQSAEKSSLKSENPPLKLLWDLEKYRVEDGDKKSSRLKPLDFRELNEKKEIASSSIYKPIQASSDEPMKSFHLGRNFSYRIPSNDAAPDDVRKTNSRKKKSNKKGSSFREKSNNPADGMFEKGGIFQEFIAQAVSSVPKHFKWML